MEEQLPSAIALDLAAAYRKQMAHPPALSSMPFPTTSEGGGGGGGAAAGASSYATYSPLRGNKGPEGPLSQAVAEGLVASEQEQQAASEEAWGAKQSAGKRDEGCVVM